MSREEVVKSLIEGFKTTADIKAVYGEPMTFFGKTLIPIARVGYGLGAGEGKKERAGVALAAVVAPSRWASSW